MQTAVIGSDLPSLELKNRSYGLVSRAQERFFQEIPTTLLPIGEDIRQQSKLLNLADNPLPSKEAIFEAYGEDLKLFQRYHREFEGLLKQAVRCSIVIHGKEKPEEETDKAWKKLQSQMPAIGKAPTLELSYIRAAKETRELLAELKAEINPAIDRLLRVFTFWLQELVETEFIGLVEWTAPDICRYHYFHQEVERETVATRFVNKETFHELRPFGERHEGKVIKETVLERQRFLARHVHHIVGAKLHKIRQYRKAKPSRIREFLKAIPKWLKPHLLIVDGQITMEEAVRLKVAEETVTESETLSVYKYSPGVLLGEFNLIGWSADDIRNDRRDWQWPTLLGAVCLIILVGTVTTLLLVGKLIIFIGTWLSTLLS